MAKPAVHLYTRDRLHDEKWLVMRKEPGSTVVPFGLVIRARAGEAQAPAAA